MKKVSSANITKFNNLVWNFYSSNKRALPWRSTTNSYLIFISEIMLQQTQVSRVHIKYNEFIHTFPTWDSLYKASLADILAVWQGLGYNRRALHLKKAIQIIVEKYHSTLPETYEDLIELPGIGKNTAGSLLAFAYNKPVIFIETNIRRVFIHHFFTKEDNVPDTDILPLIEKAIDRNNPREWYYALMDYGSHLAKIINNPNRKSKHYKIQPPLQGSIREVRGIILKMISKYTSLDFTELKKLVHVEDDRFNKAYNQLLREGFLEEENNWVKICN